MSIKSILGFSMAAAVLATSAAVASPAITLTSDGDYYSGAAYTLGFSFTVSQSESITALGAFDESGAGFAGAAQVGLWDAIGNLLTSAVVPAGTAGTLDGEFRYTAITPYNLSPGTTYYVGAFEPDETASSLGTGQGGAGSVNSVVSIIQDQFSDNNYAFSFPDTTDNHPGGAWLGANFELSGVPEPATWALMLVGCGLTGGVMRAGRKTAAA